MICGGMMEGNCATGSPFIATRPPMIVMIDMTIATIGRAMKNRDTGYLAPAEETDEGDPGAPGVVAGAPGVVDGPAAAVTGFGSTTAPGRTFCVPSMTIRSPGESPFVTTQNGPVRSAVSTGRISTRLSGPTTATW